MKSLAKKILPDFALEPLRAGRDALQRAAEWPSAAFHPWRRVSIARLGALHNAYAGRRCFVVGNGPSLRGMDLSPLRDEMTFGMNRIFLMFPELGFQTSFLVAVNNLVIEQSAPELRALQIPKFFSWRSRHLLYPAGEPAAPDAFTHFLFTTYTGPRFALNAAGRLWESATVTYVCLQLAFHMGFDEVILIGVDHNFVTQGPPNTTITSQGDDPNHFDPRYFGKGFRWQLPDLETSELGYRMARAAFEQAGRRVLDATVGGKLQVFPKVDYTTLF